MNKNNVKIMRGLNFMTLGIFAFATGILMIPYFSQAEELNLTREVFLEKGYAPEAKTIVRTHDNGLIIAGTNSGQAWAIKTGEEGNFKWRYVKSPINKSTNPLEAPKYVSAAVMPDDSVFLCGNMPDSKGSSGLLTHLDKDGKILNEQLLNPQGLAGGSFSACTVLNDEIIAVGLIGIFKPVQPTTDHPRKMNREFYYWISAFDSSGKIKWEKLVSISSKLLGLPNTVSPLQLTKDNGFVFSATRNGVSTEVVHVTKNGDIATQMTYADSFTIVLTTQIEKDIELISMPPNSLTRIILNDDLKEISRITEKRVPFTVLMSYRLSDQSLALFGSLFSSIGNKNFEDAGVLLVDKTLQHAQLRNLSPNHDSIWADAAIPLSKHGEFVVARTAINYKARNTNATPPDDDIYFGVALDFVRVK